VSRADSKALWAMVTLQGGKCQLRLDRFCTHLIVSKVGGIKYETASRHQIHIVTPDWVTECSKKGNLLRESEFHPKLLVYSNSSTALITGFMDEDVENNTIQEEQNRTKAMLEQLKQRMPWNQPKSQSIISSPILTKNQNVSLTSSPVYLATTSKNISNLDISNQSIQQSQQQLFQWTSSPATSIAQNTTSMVVSSVQNTIQQSGWHSPGAQTNNMLSMKSPTQQEVSTSQIMNSQNLHQSQQQIINQQQELIQIPQQTQISQPSINTQTISTQHQQGNTQLLHHLSSPQQLTSQQQLVQQQQILPHQQRISQQQIITQQQTASQQQLTPQQQLTQHLGTQQQIIAQQQITPQQLTSQQQLVLQQKQLLSQVHLNQQQPQHMSLQQNPVQKQQLTPEQCQQMLLLQQQQKIQQISQQLQQSVPQNSQQFVIRETQLQQQQSSNQLISSNQQNFMVQRDTQWQQQQYQLQLQRQQQQQIPGQQRSGTQWTQLPQQPRQLIQLDAQTHQQLQQLDPQQRAQFIQKIQKQKTLLFQRHIQRQAQQQGPHVAVIRSPGKPGQPGGIQWVSQSRSQMMGPQVIYF
jgi:PAX-interacting protein 1